MKKQYRSGKTDGASSEQFLYKKSLGQHFLNSPVVPQWLSEAGEVSAADTVLEIGPGTGALTRALLATGAKVIALEADQRAIAVLADTFPEAIAAGQLTIHHHDVRTLDLTEIGLTDHSFKVVANIPYYLSGFLFRSLLESDIQPTTLVFLVQKEVAKRIVSGVEKGSKESLLSLSVKAFGEPTYVKTVSRGHFTPTPAVDSAIIAINHIGRENFTDADPAIFFNLIHLGFGQRRKQLVGNLTASYPRQLVLHCLSTLGLPADIRAEDVSLPNWLALTKLLSVPTPSSD